MSHTCDPTDCSPPGSSVHGILQARTLEWVAHFLLQGIFLTQGSNPSLLHWQEDSLPLSHLGNPKKLEIPDLVQRHTRLQGYPRHLFSKQMGAEIRFLSPKATQPARIQSQDVNPRRLQLLLCPWSGGRGLRLRAASLPPTPASGGERPLPGRSWGSPAGSLANSRPAPTSV